MMKFFMLAQIALRAIWQNKTRSMLTMLGVIIGVWAVSLLVAIGNGLQALVTQQFESFGANNIYVAPGTIFSEDGSFSSQEEVVSLANNPLTIKDVKDIAKLRDYITATTSLSLSTTDVSFKEVEKRVSVTGVTSEYSQITNTDTEVGRFFDKSEENKKARVAVLGSNIAEDLFGDIDPVGRTILVNNQQFNVVGIAIEKGGGFGGPSFDDYIYIPVYTWFDLFDTQQIFRIIAQAKPDTDIKEGIKAIEDLLGRRLDEDEFSVFEQTEILDVISQILGGLTAGLGGIAAISLIVGGIGIMNIMLVSVTERTREIGLRKAIGATPNIIMLQFLIEAVVLSILGGLIGIGLAYLAGLGISRFIPTQITLDAVLLAFSVSVTVGVIFGVYPARRAAKLSPIEALRYE